MRRVTLPAAVLVAALLAPAGADAGFANHRWSPTFGGPAPKKPAKRPTKRPTRKPPKHPTSKPPTPRPPKPPTASPPVRPPVVFPQPKPLARVQVVAREFSLTLSRTALPAGRVAIELANFGEDPHDLRVERADDPAAGLSFTLAKPRSVTSQRTELSAGEWKLYCTLAGHEALGMSARIAVTG